ncbi:hypothetical protein MRX96_010496 [Rhipicephalus microplus]
MRGQTREPCGQIGQKGLPPVPAGLSPPSNCYSGANTVGPLGGFPDWPTPLSLRGQLRDGHQSRQPLSGPPAIDGAGRTETPTRPIRFAVTEVNGGTADHHAETTKEGALLFPSDLHVKGRCRKL